MKTSKSASVAIVSPFALYSGHHLNYTRELARRLVETGVRVQIHTTTGDDLRKSVPSAEVYEVCRWAKNLHRAWKIDRNRNSWRFKFLQNLETVCCAISVWKRRKSLRAVYWQDARHQIMLSFVRLMSNLRHVNLVLGPVPFGGPARMPARAKFLYRQALGTNNFRIVAETRSVAAEWAMLAGKNVLEIPVALDEMPEETLSISRKDLGIDPDAFVCLLYGTHRSDKDYRTVVCAAMKANSKPWLLFAGPVISDNDPAIVVREAGFSRVSVMNKLLNEEESAGYFHVSNCVVLPYPEAYEKGSAVLLQACKYDLPVIAADTGHLSRFVSEHSTGLLYSPGNAENLAAKMDEMRAILTQDPNAWKDALAAVRRKFGWPSLIKRYLEALDFGQQPDSR